MKLQRRKAYNAPITWTEAEEKKLLNFLKKEVFDAKKLKGLFPKRTLPSIRSKVRKLRIKHDLFGAGYRDSKEDFTTEVAEKVKAKIVFDAYAGAGHQTFKWIEVANIVFASEIMKSKLAQFEKAAKKNGFTKLKGQLRCWRRYSKGKKKVYFFIGDAIDAAADLKVNLINIDVIDLDTCGSTLPALPTFLVLLKPKHIVITHGEFHSMRFKREDVLRRLFTHRDISSNPLPLNVEDMSAELDKAVKTAALRAHNETVDSFWLDLKTETWLGSKFHGMLRRHYKVKKPAATSDCINELSA
jgi:SAM-dependent methyltransferase